MTGTKELTHCPNCGAEIPEGAVQCPACGANVAAKKRAWYQNLTPTEVFLLVLGSIMLLIAVVAL